MDELFGGGLVKNIYGLDFKTKKQFAEWYLEQEGLGLPKDSRTYRHVQFVTGAGYKKKHSPLWGAVHKGRYDWLMIDGEQVTPEAIAKDVTGFYAEDGGAIVELGSNAEGVDRFVQELVKIFKQVKVVRTPCGLIYLVARCDAPGESAEQVEQVEQIGYPEGTLVIDNITSYLDSKVAKEKISSYLSSLPSLEYTVEGSPFIITKY